jgi:hypothetical protein
MYEKMASTSIIKISPPRRYGRVKKALFRLGARAYCKPLNGRLFDAAATFVSVPLWLLNPDYNYGGLRRAIRNSCDRATGRTIAVQPLRIYTTAEVEGLFWIEEGGQNRDCQLLRLAVRNLDHYAGKPNTYRWLSTAGRFLLAVSMGLAFWSKSDNDSVIFPLIYVFGGYLAWRILRQTRQDIDLTSRQLLEFIGRTEPELLVNNLKYLAVSRQTRESLERYFVGQVLMRNIDEEILVATRNMRIKREPDKDLDL